MSLLIKNSAIRVRIIKKRRAPEKCAYPDASTTLSNECARRVNELINQLAGRSFC